MNNEQVSEKEVESEVKVEKDPNVYFVRTHVNKKISVRLYSSRPRALEFLKQARSIGVMSEAYKVKSGKEERDFIELLQNEGITVQVMDETGGVVAGLKKLGGKLLGAVGL